MGFIHRFFFALLVFLKIIFFGWGIELTYYYQVRSLGKIRCRCYRHIMQHASVVKSYAKLFISLSPSLSLSPPGVVKCGSGRALVPNTFEEVKR